MSTKRIADYANLLEGDDEVIERLLQEWDPSVPNPSENDLYRWLTQKLPDVPMTAQYGIAKAKAGIVLEDRHIIEVTPGFSDASDLDRCLGRLERYRLKWVEAGRGSVSLVIVGDSDPELRDMLYQWFSRTSADFFQTWFYVVEKATTRTCEPLTAA